MKQTVKKSFNTSKHNYKPYIHGYKTENNPEFKL